MRASILSIALACFAPSQAEAGRVHLLLSGDTGAAYSRGTRWMTSFTGNVGMLLDIYRGLGARAEISFSARPSWWTPGSGNAWIGGGLGLDYSHRLGDFLRINFAAGAHYAPFGYQNPRGISVAKHPISGFVYYQQLGLQLGSILTMGVRVQELPGRDTIIATSVYWEVVAF